MRLLAIFDLHICFLLVCVKDMPHAYYAVQPTLGYFFLWRENHKNVECPMNVVKILQSLSCFLHFHSLWLCFRVSFDFSFDFTFISELAFFYTFLSCLFFLSLSHTFTMGIKCFFE